MAELRRDDDLTGCHIDKGCHHRLRLHVLEQVAINTTTQGRDHILALIGHGDHHHARRALQRTQLTQHLQPAEVAHVQVKQHQIGLQHTRHLHAFDADIPLQPRIDAIATWMTAPGDDRARFTAVYLEQVDQAGHDSGPSADATREAIRKVDAAIGELLARLDAAGIAVDVVVVSDHGMAEVPEGHYLAVEDMASREEAEVVSVGQVIGLAPREGHEAAVTARLAGRHPHYQCWRRQDIPARLHYGSHPRVPALVCQMDEGWNALPRAWLDRRDADGSHDRGAHGYDPDSPTMRAVFIAHGPSFREGVVLPPFDNIDVYPLLARRLGIAPQPNDGDPATLLPALRPL